MNPVSIPLYDATLLCSYTPVFQLQHSYVPTPLSMFQYPNEPLFRYPYMMQHLNPMMQHPNVLTILFLRHPKVCFDTEIECLLFRYPYIIIGLLKNIQTSQLQAELSLNKEIHKK